MRISVRWASWPDSKQKQRKRKLLQDLRLNSNLSYFFCETDKQQRKFRLSKPEISKPSSFFLNGLINRFDDPDHLGFKNKFCFQSWNNLSLDSCKKGSSIHHVDRYFNISYPSPHALKTFVKFWSTVPRNYLEFWIPATCIHNFYFKNCFAIFVQKSCAHNS